MSKEPTKLCARCGKNQFDILHNKEVNDADPNTHAFIENVAPRKPDMADLLYIGQQLVTFAAETGECWFCDITQNGGCHEWDCICFGLDPTTKYDDLEEEIDNVVEALYGEDTDEDEGCGREDCLDCNPTYEKKIKPVGPN